MQIKTGIDVNCKLLLASYIHQNSYDHSVVDEKTITIYIDNGTCNKNILPHKGNKPDLVPRFDIPAEKSNYFMNSGFQNSCFSFRIKKLFEVLQIDPCSSKRKARLAYML